jgi:hypothetical protein
VRNDEGRLMSELSEDDIKLGAKVYVLNKLRDGKTGVDLEEEIRMNPCTEDEAFMYAGIGCEFNAPNIQNQIKELEDTPVFLRQQRLIIEKKKEKNITNNKEREVLTVKPMDDEKGGWFILEYPLIENAFKKSGDYFEPSNKAQYQIGVDTTQDRIAINGSNPAILVFKKSLIVNGEELGNYPVAIWISPTRLDIHFDEEVMKACMWYGCTANYELDRRTDFYRYFCKENAQLFLEWTPKIAMNPLKNKSPEYGTRSGDPFQLAQQLQIAKMYIDGTDNNNFNGHVHRIKYIELLKQLLKYDHLDRTKSDLVISLMMALLPVFGEAQLPKQELYKPKRLIPHYQIKIPA